MSSFNPSRLREILALRGIRANWLAERVGVSKQAISKYITGKSAPSPEVLDNLMNELNVPLTYLTAEKPSPAHLTSPLFFRTNRTTAKTAKEKARIMIEWGYELVSAGNAFQSRAFLEEVPEDLDVYEKELFLRESWGLGTEPIDALIALLESHGIPVFTADTSELGTDAYSQMMDQIPIIVLNRQKGTAVRQRFSIAHELGHLILHRHLSSTEFELRNQELEEEASDFASEFLLPSVHYERFLSSRDVNLLLPLKQKWKFSMAAMVDHCNRRALISDVEAKRYRVQLSKKWGRKAEPFDDVLENERPTLLADQIRKQVFDQQSFEQFLVQMPLPVHDVEGFTSLPQGFFAKYTVPVPANQRNECEQLSLFR